MATLPRLQPERFYDLVVEVAIIRPGPIVGQMVHPYLNRRAGREPVTYAHPDLEPILKRTLGVPLFQEQLLRMAMTLAGFTGGEAEELRRAMGFKRSVGAHAADRGAPARRHGARAASPARPPTTIIRSITSFALYGFPECHAASFALLAYASAYLRAHHLAAFTCAMLNNWPMGFYHPATLVKDAQRHGLRVLPIDVTRSSWRCRLEALGRSRLSGWSTPLLRDAESRGPTRRSNRLCSSSRPALRHRPARGSRRSASKPNARARRSPPSPTSPRVAACATTSCRPWRTSVPSPPSACTRREAAVASGGGAARSRCSRTGTSGPRRDSPEVTISRLTTHRLRTSPLPPAMSPLDRTLADYTTAASPSARTS